MFDVIITLAAVVIIAAMVAAPMDLANWMARENRTFFFMKMYRKWCIKKGKRIVADAKKTR